MSRSKRFKTTGVPQLILLSGNKDEPCFFVDKDYTYFLELLDQVATEFNCEIHAYVLMPNHVHLLATPHSSQGLPNLMQSLSARYATHIKTTYGRTDNIWQSGYKSCPVESELFLLKTMYYIEQNPVRASLVDQLADYRWSSYSHNALAEISPTISAHALYLNLSEDNSSRAAAYLKLISQPLDADTVNLIGEAMDAQQVLGSDEFAEKISSADSEEYDPANCTTGCVMFY